MGALTHNGEVIQVLPADASQVNFNNTGTNLNATQTENAIKEVNTKVNTNTEDITQLKSGLDKKAEIITTGTFNALKVMRCADVESISVEYGSPTVDMAANTWVDVAVAPAIYRPSTERYLSTYVVGTSGQAICSARVSIKPDGTIRFNPGALIAKDTPIFWIVTFII